MDQVVHYGKLYKETAVPLVLTFDGTNWAVTENGGYDAMTVKYVADTVAPALGNGTITLSMGSSGDADITLTTTAALRATEHHHIGECRGSG